MKRIKLKERQYVIVRVHLSGSSRFRGLKARAQREPMAS